MNAQKELIAHIDGREVKYVHIVYKKMFGNEIVISGTLEDVVERMNFEYDSGYGTQEVYGHIWYKDGTWSDRVEYNGSEWWLLQLPPPIPKGGKDGQV